MEAVAATLTHMKLLSCYIGLMIALFVYTALGAVGHGGWHDMSGGRGLASFVFMLMLYFLPTVIVMVRNASLGELTALINVLTGWTGIGWIVAFVLSLVCKPVYD